ncbi:MAG: ATP-binding protein [Aphanocapsa sp. GSE-SYN-MK-11-07L]|jgi:hypothetical protein|nr:ATP-binding protein [Aphanocapsa sp. GSE-SYN-MK-11-07L]
MPLKNLYFDDILAIIESALSCAGDAPLREAEIVVLNGAWHGLTYAEMAEDCPYNEGSLCRTVAPPLWKRLSSALNLEVTKPKFRALMETVSDRLERDNPSYSAPEHRFIGTPPLVNNFVGRGTEIQELIEAVKQFRCIFVGGAVGIGKSSLAAKVFNLLTSMGGFDVFVWKYCNYDDPAKDVEDLLKLLQQPEQDLIDGLRSKKHFIILDGIDRWMLAHRPQAEQLIRKLIESEHRSHILFTICESLALVNYLIGGGRSVREFKLTGLTLKDAKSLCATYGIEDSVAEGFSKSYDGIPLLLHKASERIQLMGGNFEAFMGNKTSLASYLLADHISQILTQIGDTEKFILSFLAHKLDSESISQQDALLILRQDSNYTTSMLLKGLDLLERLHLIDIKRSSTIAFVSIPRAIQKQVRSNMNLSFST